MPLIIINFVGAFIATFQTMGNIFLLTFGGPGDETRVLSLLIWVEAYNNLRFGVATAMAWILGSALIGFAYLQINILRKVEFRRVEEV
jgi:multiple sugar transport system permease protein